MHFTLYMTWYDWSTNASFSLLDCHSSASKEQTSFNIMIAVTVHSDFGAQENEICHCFYFFPFYLPWSDGTRCHDLNDLNVEFQASFILSKRLFSSSSLSAYLRLLVFLLVVLIPACDTSSLTFHTMYSTYKLNKQGDNIQPWSTLFPRGTSPLFHVQF